MRSLTHRRGQRGAVLVEFVLILPVLLLLLFGIIEFGFAIYGKHTVVQVSRDGARLAETQSRVNVGEITGEPTYVKTVKDSISADLKTSGTFAGLTPVRMAVYAAEAPNLGISQRIDSGNFSSCVQYCTTYSSWNTTTGKFDTPGGTNWYPGDQSACLDESASPPQHPDAIGVYVEVKYTSFTPLIGDLLGGTGGKHMSSNTVMRLEPLPPGACGP